MKQAKVFRVVVKMVLTGFLFLGLVFATMSDAQAQFTPVPLINWTAESYRILLFLGFLRGIGWSLMTVSVFCKYITVSRHFFIVTFLYSTQK